jgi:hypothetical protein
VVISNVREHGLAITASHPASIAGTVARDDNDGDATRRRIGAQLPTSRQTVHEAAIFILVQSRQI